MNNRIEIIQHNFPVRIFLDHFNFASYCDLCYQVKAILRNCLTEMLERSSVNVRLVLQS